ncbi:MAG: hypothetical protein K0S18_359 [Anaerocolumna sp.]|jgi:hypothetical protein|nr:hypothetical protein [Anaerocolumna sp.]
MWVNQIFSLIDSDGTIQNIIVADNYEIANQISRDLYGDGAYAEDTTQYPLGIGCKHINGLFYREDGVTEVPRNLTAEEEANLARIKAEQLEKIVIPTINVETCTLDELKAWQIKQSEKNLEEYLKANPILSTAHKPEGAYYSITKDKQTYLGQMIMIAQMAMQAGQQYQPSWNEAEQPCTYDWTLTELQQLAFEIEAVVRPKVNAQQHMDESIRACTTKEEVLAVDITF